MEIIKRVKTTSRWMRFMMAIVILVATYTVVGFLILPVVLKSVLAKQLSENLQREAVIQDIDLNPYALKLSVKGLTIKEREGSDTFVSFDELYLNAQTISAFKRAVVLRELRLEKPYFNIIRHEVNRFNFSDLAGAEKQQEKEEEKASAPIRFSLNNIQVINGAIDFWDGPKKKQHKIADLNIGVPFISSLPYNVHIFVQPLFAAKFNDTSISLEGQSKPFADSRETSIDVDLSDINIPYYLAYVPMKLGFKMLDGHLDVKGTVTYTDKPEGESILSLAGDLHLRNLEFVDNEDRPLMKLPSVGVSIASAEPLAKKIHLSKVLFQSPEVSVRRGQGGNVNFQALFPEQETETETPETEVPETDVLDTEVAEEEGNGPPFSIMVDDMQIATGKVAFSDLAAGEPFDTTLEPVNVSVLHFSNDEGKQSTFSVSFQTEAKESLELDGEFSVEPVAAEGTLHLQGVPIGKYAPYYGETVAFTVEDGNLELQTQFSYHAGDADPELNLSGISLDLASLNLKKIEDQEPFAQIPVLSVKETNLSLTGRELNAGEIHTEGGQLHCLRYKNGDLNLTTLVPHSEEPAKTEEPTRTEESPGEGKPWHVTLNKVSMAGYAVKVEDLAPVEPVNFMVEGMTLNGEKISTIEDSQGTVDLSFQVNKKGTFSTKGTIGTNPVAVDLNLNVKDLDIKWAQPYVSEQLQIVLADGRFSTKGDFSLRPSEQGDMITTYKGQVGLSDLACLDKTKAEKLVAWKSLRLDDTDFMLNPFHIKIGKISLDELFAHVVVNPDKKLNLQTIVAEKEEEDPQPSKEGETSHPIDIGEVRLKGGHIRFVDKSIEPSYSTELSDIEGSVKGLSSQQAKPADVSLRGKLDKHAPLEIKGRINPLSEDLFLDLKVVFQNVELSPVSPYSGKFVGYTLEKGELSLDLEYRIDKKQIDSKNKFFVDQLTFGDAVESPDAVSLPVKLGVALLKNRAGEIDLDIPVSGSMDDPEFKVGKIILQTFMNLLVKAATSPFALLGAIVGGGEELSVVEFEYGRSNISPEAQKKLDTLAEALYERPSLDLDVEGHIDIEKDKEGLMAYLFDKKLRAQKLKRMTKKGSPVIPIDEVKIEPDEYEEYLKKAYKAETFKKPKNLIGLNKSLPAPEMEKLIRENMTVQDDDLKQLASERAKAVEAYLLQSEKIEPERIFLVKPKSLVPEKKEGLKDSRVNLSLK